MCSLPKKKILTQKYIFTLIQIILNLTAQLACRERKRSQKTGRREVWDPLAQGVEDGKVAISLPTDAHRCLTPVHTW